MRILFSVVVLQTHVHIKSIYDIIVLIWKLFPRENSRNEKMPKKKKYSKIKSPLFTNHHLNPYKKKKVGLGLRRYSE